jgi:hypothetical protein
MKPPPGDETKTDEPVPVGQRVFDNMYLMLALGVVVMIVIYTAWGVWEIISMPQGRLP